MKNGIKRNQMVMHNGPAGITVGMVAIPINDAIMPGEHRMHRVFGTISAARRGRELRDEWSRLIGLNRVMGRLERVEREGSSFNGVFFIGTYSGPDLGKDVFGPAMDLVRNQRPRRSVISLENRLIRILNRNFVRDEATIYDGAVEEAMSDEGVVIPAFKPRALTFHQRINGVPVVADCSVEADTADIPSPAQGGEY